MNRLPWGVLRPEGTPRGRWSPDEIAYLQDWYGLKDIKTLARELARRPRSVRRQAELVCRSARRSGPWTAAEVVGLKRYLGVATQEVIAGILGRDVKEVQRQVFELGRVRRDGAWSREEIGQFKRNYGSRSDEDLALIFSRRVEDVRALARELHLAKDKVFLKRNRPKQKTSMPRWSAESLRRLRELYPTESNFLIAKHLGRSVKSIVSKAHHLGLKKKVERLRQMGRENKQVRHEA